MPDLDAIRARADKATPGPWCWQATGEKDNSWALGTAVWPDDSPVRPEHGSVDEQENERWDETTGTGDQAVVIECIAEHYGIANNFTDADFIAHAREDVPALLNENDRLRVALIEADRIIAARLPFATVRARRVMRAALATHEIRCGECSDPTGHPCDVRV